MISQSVAECLAKECKNLKILFITLNKRESKEFVNETVETIESVKSHIDSKMISQFDFLNRCKVRNNFYMMGGLKNELEERFYFPDSAQYLLREVCDKFDIVICDSGNEIDSGLAVGAMQSTDNRTLLLTQQETILSRWEKNRSYYDKLKITFDTFVINQYYSEDPYTEEYLCRRLELPKEKVRKVVFAGYARQAEIDGQTLMEYKNEYYVENITRIANDHLLRLQLEEIKIKRKNKWKSFI